MPFDGTGFPQQPPKPERAASTDNAVSTIIIAVAFALLVMPISLTALVDVIRYVRGS